MNTSVAAPAWNRVAEKPRRPRCQLSHDKRGAATEGRPYNTISFHLTAGIGPAFQAGPRPRDTPLQKQEPRTESL